MERHIRQLAGRFGGNGLTIIAIIVLLFPSSASVLCIAPGGHVAIEDINAPCCAPSGVTAPTACQPGNEFNAPGNCHNCRDLFMTPSGRGALLASCDNVAANPFADECAGDRLLADSSLWPSQSGAINDIYAPPPVSYSVPLRC